MVGGGLVFGFGGFAAGRSSVAITCLGNRQFFIRFKTEADHHTYWTHQVTVCNHQSLSFDVYMLHF